MTNCTFAQRSDGSYLMVNRSGEVWISKDGNKDPYRRVSNRSAYPAVSRARFEDPVVWKDDVQYNLIVNDWFGRAAYYLRSRDGQRWEWDHGLAYGPGIFRHEDGRIEDWHKIERPRVVQDARGRATHMMFAVIDDAKEADKPNDIHSSKAIGVEIVPPRTIRVRKEGDRFVVTLEAEGGFLPARDTDPATIRFGAPSRVDFGKAAAPRSTTVQGNSLVAEFSAADCGFQAHDRTAKLLASDRMGGFVFGYPALPGEPEENPFLSAHGSVKFGKIENGAREMVVEVGNFGLARSPETEVNLQLAREGRESLDFMAPLPALAPYEAVDVKFRIPADLVPIGSNPSLEIRITANAEEPPLRVRLPTLP